MIPDLVAVAMVDNQWAFLAVVALLVFWLWPKN
jgi:hypothetical protein